MASKKKATKRAGKKTSTSVVERALKGRERKLLIKDRTDELFHFIAAAFANGDLKALRRDIENEVGLFYDADKEPVAGKGLDR